MIPNELRQWHEHQATIRRASAARYASALGNPKYNEAQKKRQLKWAVFHDEAAKCVQDLMQHAEDQFYAGIDVGYGGANL